MKITTKTLKELGAKDGEWFSLAIRSEKIMDKPVARFHSIYMNGAWKKDYVESTPDETQDKD
jgi:hypothetical protein